MATNTTISIPGTNVPAKPFPITQPASSTPTRKQKQRTIEKFEFSYKGKPYSAGSAREVMTKIFDLLAKDDPSFFERFSARKHGKKRRYLANSKVDLYPGRPDLVETASMEITPGWWIGTNYSRRDIQKIITLAKEVIDPEISKQLVVNVEKS